MNRKSKSSSIAALCALALLAAPPLAAQGGEGGHGGHDHPVGYGEKLGTVVLPGHCLEKAEADLRRGLALLHHMTYESAREAFLSAADVDPGCATAAWGQAMSYIHPLWSDPPTEAGFRIGKSLAERAVETAATEREAAWARAALAYYTAGRAQKESANLAAFEAGWKAAHEADPDDPEAAAFWALSQLGVVDPGDKTFARQRAAGALAQSILERIPDHPGGHHYTIHAYDVPPLAGEALAVARSYGEIAPRVPHALHMPTHIFTRLGLWTDSIEWNRRSAEAALDHPVDGAVSMHHLHALDYLVYAHLQRGEDGLAREVAARIERLDGPFQAEVASPYTLAAVPARIALERQRWGDAAALAPRRPADFPWDRFPAVEAITHFARALGAARNGDPATARAALERLAALRDAAAASSPYWAQQVEIQRLAAQAWLEHAEGASDAALATMRAAAELEASTEKHPVTPGEVLPARELLGEMLLLAGRLEEARVAFDAALERSPGRLNSLYGSARAAEAAGDAVAAEARYRQILEACETGDAEWDRLAATRAAMSRIAAAGSE